MKILIKVYGREKRLGTAAVAHYNDIWHVSVLQREQ
jgi:hypothetical protein